MPASARAGHDWFREAVSKLEEAGGRIVRTEQPGVHPAAAQRGGRLPGWFQ
jgi:hypothetical protein